MLKKAAAVLLVCAGIATWSSCGKKTNRYLYAAVPGASEIFVYRQDPNSGILTALDTSPVTAGSGVQSVMVHPSGKFLYAANSGSSDISRFDIADSGSLTEETPRTNAGTAPTVLQMDAAGAFLYVANSGSNDISVFKIDASSGALTAVGSPFPIGISPLNMKLSPSGNFLYVTGAVGLGQPGFVEAFSLSAGVPTAVEGSPFQAGTNPYGLAIDPSGTHLYTANAVPDNSISEFTINSDGSLSVVQGSPIGESFSGPICVLVDQSGKFLFVANEGSNNIGAYAVGSDGGLTLLTNSPFSAATEPNFITSDPGGKYLYVGNQSAPVIQVFSMDNTGTLTSVATYSVGNTPTSIALTK